MFFFSGTKDNVLLILLLPFFSSTLACFTFYHFALLACSFCINTCAFIFCCFCFCLAKSQKGIIPCVSLSCFYNRLSVHIPLAGGNCNERSIPQKDQLRFRMAIMEEQPQKRKQNACSTQGVTCNLGHPLLDVTTTGLNVCKE